MSRRAGALLLAVFLAPLGLRLAAASTDSAALRCAIACARATAAMGMTKGASCCPTAEDPGSGPVLKTCSRGAEAALTLLVLGPMLLALVGQLRAPRGSRLFDSGSSAFLSSAFLRAPDKVPLLG